MRSFGKVRVQLSIRDTHACWSTIFHIKFLKISYLIWWSNFPDVSANWVLILFFWWLALSWNKEMFQNSTFGYIIKENILRSDTDLLFLVWGKRNVKDGTLSLTWLSETDRTCDPEKEPLISLLCGKPKKPSLITDQSWSNTNRRDPQVADGWQSSDIITLLQSCLK